MEGLIGTRGPGATLTSHGRWLVSHLLVVELLLVKSKGQQMSSFA